MPVSKRRKLVNRRPVMDRPYSVQLSYVNQNLSIRFARYQRLEDARKFCVMWIANSAELPPELWQRAEIYKDRVRLAVFETMPMHM